MRDNENDKTKLLYITHSGELLFWLIVILLIIAISNVFRVFEGKNNENVYNIFMPDIDGLIVGSPVRMMGIEVGHVTKIKPTNEDVYVKFMITNPDIKVPQGTIATVEFSGMAGSKSLELYLPDEQSYVDKSAPILDVSPPKRLHDAFGLLNEMFNELGSIIKVSSSFAGKLKTIDLPKGGSPVNVKEFLDYSNEVLDNSIVRAENLEKKLNARNKK